MAFGNLTVDFRQLSKIPVRDRVTLAQSPQASSIFGNLSPIEIAALFPDYYKKFIPASAGGTSLASGMTGAGYTGGGGGTGTAPSTGGATPAPTGPVVPALIQEIYDAAGPMPSNSPGGNFTPRERAVLDFIAKREGSRDPNIVFGGQRYVKQLGLDKKPLTEHTIAEVINDIMPRLRQLSKADGYGKTNDGRIVGTSAVGTGQMIEGTLKANLAALRIPEKDWDKIKFDKTLQERLTLSNFRTSGIGDPNADPDTWNMRVLADQYESLNPRRPSGKAITASEKAEIKSSSPVRPEQLPGTAPIDQAVPSDETGIIPLEQGGTATVVPQTQAFDPAIFSQLDPRIQEYYNTATEDEKKQLEYALTKTGVAKVNEIAQKHPRATAETMTTTVVQDAQQSAMNVSEAINQDPLEFWKARNPQGARIDDLDIETLRTAMMAAIKLEADMIAKGAPKKVEIYGPSSGVRTDPSKAGSRHGVNFKEALDVAIYDVDPNTGQKLTNKSGPYGNYPNIPGHGGIDPEGFALYHEFGQNAELARMFLANRGDERYQGWGIRQGQLFSDTQFDFMHIDRTGGVNPDTGVSIHVAPHGVGSVAGGMTEAGVRKLGIDPNSDAGRRLMTGVTERFGKTRQDIALSAEAAYGQRPGVETTATQSLPATEAQTQTPNINPETGSDVNTINLEQPQQANTNMALGGTKSTDVEPNMVNEKYTIAQTDPKTGETKPIANFNKDEEVNIKDGQMNVDSAYKKKAEETLQKTDTGMPNNTQNQNQYSMRQTSDRPKDALAEQVKYGFVPRSPSYERSVTNSKFGISHFNIGAKSQYS